LVACHYGPTAAEAKKRAAEASNPHVKSAFKEVARGWLVLAEQMEWMEHQEEVRPWSGEIMARAEQRYWHSSTGQCNANPGIRSKTEQLEGPPRKSPVGRRG
jgi:hypothetical protein